ncbi:MAG: MATE family efflux transporter [Treponema sp.]|uniref:MATE family efflux transporter n=1 Tax=Treponema sp. TaxID=166 RepID=UPI00257F63AF|nr:MATE family efflux transporter [Treponema sp.]MBQ5537489.1 MATE family efflux transporter [Treponema sp.]
MEKDIQTIEERGAKPLFDRAYLFRLILPLVAEQFLAMTIGACDTLMVSSIGEAGVSGVSLVDQFSQLMIQLFAAFATGGAVVSSQYLGHGSPDNARMAAKQLFNVAGFIAVALVVICLPLRKPILGLLYGKSEADVMKNALDYFVWILVSFPFLAIYNSSAALFRSMGNSKISLKVSMVMNFINISGNAVFIYGAGIGVNGAGLATLLSRAVAACVMLFLLGNRNNEIYIDKFWKVEVNFPMIRRILTVGIPSGIENSVFHIGKILVQSFMSGFGTVAIAANAISNTIASFSNIPGSSIGLGCVTIIGRCIGAGEKGQAKSYGKKLMQVAYVAMFCTSMAIFILAPVLVRAFNLSDESARLASGVIRTCMCANVLLWPMSFTMPNILRAAGDAKFTMVVSNISMWAFRVLFSFLISSFIIARNPGSTHLALYGVWFGMYLDWIFRGSLFFARFCRGKWLDKKVI